MYFDISAGGDSGKPSTEDIDADDDEVPGNLFSIIYLEMNFFPLVFVIKLLLYLSFSK